MGKQTRSHFDVSQIETGWDVYGSDGEKVGDVADMGPNYFIVEKGFLFPTDLYVPTSAIQSIEHDEVRLSMTKSQIETQSWDHAPEADAADMKYDEAVSGYGSRASTGTESGTLERREEQLRVEKEPVQTGEVRIEKDVVEQQQSVDVPLEREEVHIERRAVDRPASGEAFTDEEVSIPVKEERAQVSKEARVVEELGVEKEVHQDTERVTDTVKREEFRIDDEDQTDPRGDR
jgi:uncharacterized protein (TIGR02271 family)